jgi:hypothetical protein
MTINLNLVPSFINKYMRNDLEKQVFSFLTLFLIIKIIYIYFIPITPQEAYYWYYSQNPDLSYFDHPPMAAYSIMITTFIFGNTAFGIKLAAVLWWVVTNLLLYKCTMDFIRFKNLENDYPNSPAYSLIFYNLTVFGNLYSITIVPDTPLMFFWLLMVFAIQKFLITGKNSWWFLAGAAFGFSLISKYSAIIITGSIFLFLVFNKEHRKVLLTPYPYLSLLFGIILFSPVIYWNYLGDWASFKFQFSERAQKAKPIQIKYFLQLIASQLFLLTPLIFTVFITTIVRYIKEWKQHSKFDLIFWSAMPIIIIFTLVSFKSLVKMNWLLPGYICLLILIAIRKGHLLQKPKRIVKSGIVVSVVLAIVGYSILIIPNVPLGQGNTWSGWEDASEKIYNLQLERGGKEECFIFGNSYKSAALLKFHLPDQQNTYAENIFGERALQFDYWDNPDNLIGKNALYVFDNRREYKPKLKEVAKHFENITELEKYTYNFFTGAKARTITVYFCENYLGTNE